MILIWLALCIAGYVLWSMGYSAGVRAVEDEINLEDPKA